MKTSELTIKVEVPDEATFVAVDEDGDMCWYAEKPQSKDGEHVPKITGHRGIDFGAATVTNWRETLTEVK